MKDSGEPEESVTSDSEPQDTTPTKSDEPSTLSADSVSETEPDLSAIVEEVARGEWGVGQDRRLRLAQAGYDHRLIQKKLVERANKR